MLILPGRVYEINEEKAIDEIHKQINKEGYKCIGTITLNINIPQPSKELIWYEYYAEVEGDTVKDNQEYFIEQMRLKGADRIGFARTTEDGVNIAKGTYTPHN